MICKNCGNEITDSAKFCTACGVKIENEETESNVNEGVQLCKKCNAELKNGALFCNRCGTSVNEHFQEKTYKFKQYIFNENIIKTITGEEISFKLTNHMMVINQVEKYQNKITVIPYNEIKSFKIKNKVNFISFLLAPLCWGFGLFLLSFDEVTLLLTLLFFVMGVLCIFVAPFYAIFSINFSYGKKQVFTLKRINKKQLATKEMFVNDLNNRLSSTETLSNITKKQSKIKIGYTNTKISDIAIDLAGKFFG